MPPHFDNLAKLTRQRNLQIKVDQHAYASINSSFHWCCYLDQQITIPYRWHHC